MSYAILALRWYELTDTHIFEVLTDREILIPLEWYQWNFMNPTAPRGI
jgi:hypothetical protein